MNYFELRATNNQDANVQFAGDSYDEVLGMFDAEYNRKGFKIVVSEFDESGEQQIAEYEV